MASGFFCPTELFCEALFLYGHITSASGLFWNCRALVSEKTLQTGVSTDQKDTVLVIRQERTDSQIQTFDPLSHLFLNKVCFVQQNEATRGCVCTLVPV